MEWKEDICTTQKSLRKKAGKNQHPKNSIYRKNNKNRLAELKANKEKSVKIKR